MPLDGSSKQLALVADGRQEKSGEIGGAADSEQTKSGGEKPESRWVLLPSGSAITCRDPIALPDELIPAYRAKLHERVKLIDFYGSIADLKSPEELLSRLPSTSHQSVESRLSLLQQELVSEYSWAEAFAGLPVRLEHFAFRPIPHLAEVHSNSDPSEYLRAVSTYGLVDPLPRIESGDLPLTYDLNDVFRRSQLMGSEIYREHYREGTGPTGWTRIELARTDHGVWTLAFTHALATREGRVFRRTLLARLAPSFQRLAPWLVDGERKGGAHFDLTPAPNAHTISPSDLEEQCRQEDRECSTSSLHPLPLGKNSSYIIDDAIESGELPAGCITEPEKKEFEQLARRQGELMKELRTNSKRILELSPYRVFHNTTETSSGATARALREHRLLLPVLLTCHGERVRAVLAATVPDRAQASQAKPLNTLTDDLASICEDLAGEPIPLRQGGKVNGTVLAQLTQPSGAAKATADARRWNSVLEEE